jgi:hypothetical protein
MQATVLGKCWCIELYRWGDLRESGSSYGPPTGVITNP